MPVKMLGNVTFPAVSRRTMAVPAFPIGRAVVMPGAVVKKMIVGMAVREAHGLACDERHYGQDHGELDSLHPLKS